MMRFAVSVNAALLDQLWVMVCGGNRLFVKTAKARQLLRELAHGALWRATVIVAHF